MKTYRPTAKKYADLNLSVDKKSNEVVYDSRKSVVKLIRGVSVPNAIGRQQRSIEGGEAT